MRSESLFYFKNKPNNSHLDPKKDHFGYPLDLSTLGYWFSRLVFHAANLFRLCFVLFFVCVWGRMDVFSTVNRRRITSYVSLRRTLCSAC
jgi:hypothetical protein